MDEIIKDRTVALAGVCQAAFFANELANTGRIRDSLGFESSINSLYIIDCDQALDVFEGKLANLNTGLKTLSYAFNRDPDYLGVLKYTLTLLTLERKLSKRPDYLEKIQKEILDSRVLQNPDDEEVNTAVISKFAQCYSSTISLLQPRIILNGRPEHLKQSGITEKIRSILLTGIRSAVLWNQVGGTQWQLLFKRKQLVECATNLKKRI